MNETQQDTRAVGNSIDRATDELPNYIEREFDKEKKYRNWFFTLNNPDTHNIDETLLTQIFISTNPKLFIFQKEKGKKNGTIHFQGCIAYEHARSFHTLSNLTGVIHWMVCRSLVKSMIYCSKQDTKIGKTITYNCTVPKCNVIIKIHDPMDKHLNNLHHYQTFILKLIKEEPDDRKIHWFYENKGNVGKSSFCKHLILKYDAILLCGKAADMKYAIAEMVRNNNPPKIIIFDIPRESVDFFSYTGLEEIKNGMFFSAKYTSGMCVFNIPHIICFANCKPTLEKCSMDRWSLYSIDT